MILRKIHIQLKRKTDFDMYYVFMYCHTHLINLMLEKETPD